MRNGLSLFGVFTLLALVQPQISLSSSLPSSLSSGGAPEIQAPCGVHGSLQFEDCSTYASQFHEALVKSYHERWRDLIRQGKDPDQPEIPLRACNPFRETLPLTEGGVALAFNGAPDTACGSWGQITSREKQTQSPSPDPSSTPTPPTLEWSIEMSNSSAEGALWNGITHVHFVAVALNIVLDEVKNQRGISFQYAMREAELPVSDYKNLFSKAKELTPNLSGYTCSESESVRPAQRECYRNAVKEALKLYFLRLAQARVAEIVYHLTSQLERRFPTLASSCNENGNRSRYPCNQTSEGTNPNDEILGDQVGAFLIRDLLKTPSNECAAGVLGQSCRQTRYESVFTNWIKQTASSITQEAPRGDTP